MILITSVTLVISMNLCNYWICMHHNTLDVDKFMSNCSNRVCHGFGITESDFHGNGMGFQGVANHGLSTELFGLSTELFSLTTPPLAPNPGFLQTDQCQVKSVCKFAMCIRKDDFDTIISQSYPTFLKYSV